MKWVILSSGKIAQSHVISFGVWVGWGRTAGLTILVAFAGTEMPKPHLNPHRLRTRCPEVFVGTGGCHPAMANGAENL